tara:strand:- start:350 stop:760 length:411 start_codon:yes stop_codon:yes gene_type:complete
MKKITIIIIFLFYACNSSSDVEKMLIQLSKQHNQQCPMVYDKYNTLMTTLVAKDTLKFYYQCDIESIFEDYDIPIDDYDYYIKEIKKNEIEVRKYNMCESPEFTNLRKLDATFKFIYKDLNGKYLYGVTSSSKDCK